MKGIIEENLEEEKMERQETEEKEIEDIGKEEKEKAEEKKDTKFEKSNVKSKEIEKQIEEMGEKKKKKRWIIPAIIVIIFVVAIFCSTIFALVNLNNENIISGVSIAGIDVSGLSREQATAKMNTIYQEKKEKEISVKYQDYETTLNPNLMEVNYEVEKAVEKACLVGKEDNIFINNYHILFALIAKEDIPVNMTLNEEVTRQTISDIGVNLPGIMLESSYAIENEELIITKGKKGIVIDEENLLNKIKENLNVINASEDYIEIPVVEKQPAEINIDKIHEEVYKEVQNAYYTKNPFTIYPEVVGIDFDVEAARQLLKEEKDEYVIPLKVTKPSITINQIGTEAFPDQLATFTTRYDASDTSRTTNLIIACNKINGKVVLSGETFSYNKTLGPRTVANGYKNGKIYSGGEVVDGIGGGICQISSTLYNTVLMSNLQIVERKNHQFVTSYLPAGRDATVVYGSTDFRFKNTRKYPIRIVASARNGIATVSIFGIKEENEYTFSFSTKTIASIPFTTTYQEDSSLAVGTEKVKQKGANGIKTETYITKKLNGKVISTTLLSKDTYNAMARIIIRGTKGATTKKQNTTTTTKSNTNTTSKQEETPPVGEETEKEIPEETEQKETTQTTE